MSQSQKQSQPKTVPAYTRSQIDNIWFSWGKVLNSLKNYSTDVSDNSVPLW